MKELTASLTIVCCIALVSIAPDSVKQPKPKVKIDTLVQWRTDFDWSKAWHSDVIYLEDHRSLYEQLSVLYIGKDCRNPDSIYRSQLAWRDSMRADAKRQSAIQDSMLRVEERRGYQVQSDGSRLYYHLPDTATVRIDTTLYIRGGWLTPDTSSSTLGMQNGKIGWFKP